MTDDERELEIQSLQTRKRDLLLEICYLRKDEVEYFSLYSKIKLSLTKAKLAYAETDYQLALVDGRCTKIEPIDLKKKKESNCKDFLKELSIEQRDQLLKELNIDNEEE